MNELKAAILAGGAGTRLSPITNYIPKSLIPIGGKPFLAYVFTFLRRHGIKDIVMLVSPEDAEIYRNEYRSGEAVQMNVEYSIHPRKGTAQAVYDARKLLDSSFVVYYGDVLTDLNLTNMIRFHKSKKAHCTLALSRSVPIDYGVGKINRTGRVVYFEEKPVLKEYPVSMGIHIFEPIVLDYCISSQDIAREVIPQLIKKHLRVFGYSTNKRHHDLGSFKHLNEIKMMIEEKGNTI